MSKSPRPPRVKEEMSEDLAELLRKQKQIQEWKETVQKRISRIEDVYLRDSSMGNIIRGFDQDASLVTTGPGPRNRHKDNKELDDKEKMFSGSSYAVWAERQHAAAVKEASKSGGSSAAASAGPASKKARKGD